MLTTQKTIKTTMQLSFHLILILSSSVFAGGAAKAGAAAGKAVNSGAKGGVAATSNAANSGVKGGVAAASNSKIAKSDLDNFYKQNIAIGGGAVGLAGLSLGLEFGTDYGTD